MGICYRGGLILTLIIYSGLSTTIGMLISRLIHGGHVLSGQAILVFFGVFGLMGLSLTLRASTMSPNDVAISANNLSLFTAQTVLVQNVNLTLRFGNAQHL